VNTAVVHGKSLKAKSEEHRWVDALPNFDPLGASVTDYKCDVFTVEFKNTDKAFELTWESELLERG
jgi:hypothetical protein